MNNGQYLIAANSKRGQLIFNIFRPVDLIIESVGGFVTVILLLAIQPNNLLVGILVLLPLFVCSFLVMPIANYHNVLCVIQNIYGYLTEPDGNRLYWKGWCAKDEYK